jgi:DNA-binding NtrC family response regulator
MSRRRTLVLWIDTRCEQSGHKALLERNGYQVIKADGHKEAYAVLASDSVDAIILDFELSGSSETVRRLKSIKPHIPILLIGSSGAIPSGIPSGVDAVVEENDPPARVVKILDYLLDVRFPFFARWFGNWKHRAGAYSG